MRGLIDSRAFAAVLAGVSICCASPGQPTASRTVAVLASPQNGAQITYYKQPITLVANTGVTTGRATITIVFEVATDPGFSNVIATRSLPGSANGQQTSITLDRLAAARDYVWRVRTRDENSPELVSSTFKFTVGPEIKFAPPRPLLPVPNAFEHRRPVFVVTNAARTGPSGTVTYRFEIANDPAFSSLTATGTVVEAASQTAFTPATALEAGQTYVWRVQAVDAETRVASEYSNTQAFTIRNPDDGTYAYTFRFQPPATEDCEYLEKAIATFFSHALDFPVSVQVPMTH